jgi:hypothetical protein
MSVKYELWANGDRLAGCKTLPAALSAALRRSKKLQIAVYVYTVAARSGQCIARVSSGWI